MIKPVIAFAGLFVTGIAAADSLVGVDRILCSSGQAQVCVEADTCYGATPWELAIPDFVIIDTDKKLVSTTPGSGENRVTPFATVVRSNGLISLQGAEGDRLFNFVIHEATGRLTAGITRDGISITVFGSCTDANI